MEGDRKIFIVIVINATQISHSKIDIPLYENRGRKKRKSSINILCQFSVIISPL